VLVVVLYVYYVSTATNEILYYCVHTNVSESKNSLATDKVYCYLIPVYRHLTTTVLVGNGSVLLKINILF
jgi:hypothetical protein